MPLAPSTRLGPYEIVAELGAGGMGEVYTARDTRLDRIVAVKVLRPHRLNDDARERFKREGRAIAALNHPNICQLYDVGTEGAVDYLVFEYLEGETLAERLRAGPLKIDHLMRCAVDVADALDSAHRRGIVHRDLKPANIFLTAHGITKVLDFGLAKLVHESTPDAAETVARALTGAGTTLGTVAYMSPEQARGEELDERSDLFSFGAVLYEMATGKPAFGGKTSAVIFKAILDETPVATSGRNPILPGRLDDIVGKALEKDRTLRYQGAAELRADLLRLKRDSESTARPALPGRARSYGRAGRAAMILVVVAAAAGLYFAIRRVPAARPAAWEQLTFFTDAAVYPALSPDGRMLAFIRGGSPFLTRGELYVKLLPSGDAVQLTRDGTTKLAPVFSPDGSRIVYGTYDPFDIWEVPVLGGQPSLRFKNASSLSWIEGGRRLLFSEIRDGFHMVLVTTNEARGESRDVYVPPGQRSMVHHSSLAPDGRNVLVVAMNERGALVPCQVVPYDGSGAARTVGPPRGACLSAAWSRDGKWMYVSSNDGGAFHIWRQRFPDGRLEQVTSGTTEEAGIAMTADGTALLTSVGVRDSTIWLHDRTGDHQLSSEGSAFNSKLSVDGTRLFYLMQSGESGSSLWVRTLATGASERVASGSAVQPGSTIRDYAVSHDGRQAALQIDNATGDSRIWIVPVDRRSAPRQLVSPRSEDSPAFLPNGDLIVRATEGGRNYVYRTGSGGVGRQRVVSEPIVDLLSVSPDGRWVAAVAMARDPGHDEPGTVIYPLDGGSAVPVCNFDCTPAWDLTGKFLYLASAWDSTTYILPVKDGRGIPDLPTEGFTGIADLQSDKRAIKVGDVIDSGIGTSIYSHTRQSTRRNIYRIPLPE